MINIPNFFELTIPKPEPRIDIKLVSERINSTNLKKKGPRKRSKAKKNKKNNNNNITQELQIQNGNLAKELAKRKGEISSLTDRHKNLFESNVNLYKQFNSKLEKIHDMELENQQLKSIIRNQQLLNHSSPDLQVYNSYVNNNNNNDQLSLKVRVVELERDIDIVHMKMENESRLSYDKTLMMKKQSDYIITQRENIMKLNAYIRQSNTVIKPIQLPVLFSPKIKL